MTTKNIEMDLTSFTPIGIDISKLTFDACIGEQTYKYDNTKSGFKKFASKLPDNSWCVMESTSTYCYRLADFLHEYGYRVSVVNPLSVKRLAQSGMIRTKTDAMDARLIKKYAKKAQLPIYNPLSPDIIELRDLSSLLDAEIKNRTAIKNKIEAMIQRTQPSKKALKRARQTVKYHDKAIQEIEKDMDAIVKRSCSEAYEKALSVNGIGKRTATLLLAITRGFTMFESPKQLIAYIGTCPRQYESGTSVKGKSHICKMGMKNIRSTLYMCSHSAVRYNNTCKALYQRLLAKGKAKKVALMAVINKLIHQLFACISKNEYFDNNYQKSLGI